MKFWKKLMKEKPCPTRGCSQSAIKRPLADPVVRRHVTMRILFDNSGFANLVQQPNRQISFHRLKELVSKKKLAVIGCCTLLQELAGLAQKDIQLYLKTLSEYKTITRGWILRPPNQLLIGEGKQLRPIDLQASLLDVQSAKNIISNMKVPSNAEGLFSENTGLKQGYGTAMESARIKVLMTPRLVNEPSSSIISGYREWFNNFPTIVQSWFVDMFKPKSDLSVGQLPHVSAFLGYTLTRIYESNVLNIKDRSVVGSNLYCRLRSLLSYAIFCL